MIVIAWEEAKQNRPDTEYRNLSSTNAASKPKKADIILCAHSIFCWGSVGDASARAMPYEMLVPRCECVLQRVNCHFIRALCAPSVSPCGSCRMVMDGGHQSFFEGPLARRMLVSHPAMGRHKLVCFCLPCTLCCLSFCTLKSCETKAEAWRK